MNPYDLTAGPFLAIYALAFASCLGFGLWWRQREPPNGLLPAARTQGLDPVGWAYLTGGAVRAADTAVVGLLQSDQLKLDKKRNMLLPVPLADPPPASLAAYARRLKEPVSVADLSARLAPAFEAVASDLVSRGLAFDPPTRLKRGWMSAAPLLLLTVLGAIRILLGMARERPVGFIFGFTLITLAAAIGLVLKSPLARRAGREAVARHKEASSRLARAPEADELMLAMALVGGGALFGTPYAAFAKMRQAVGGGDGGGCGGGGGGCSGGCGGCGS